MKKASRLASGGEPRLIDMFSGCGGLTLGFTTQGFISAGGVEHDPHAAASYAHNFHGGSEHFGRARDARNVDFSEVLQCPKQDLDLAIDAVVGGPPCPSFTRVGRAKLREVMDHPEAFKLDERTTLYLQMIRAIRTLSPLVVLIENVPDILNQGGQPVGDDIAEQLVELGYEVGYSLLNAANYGVPQMRDRYFLIGIAAELGAQPRFPNPTHSVDLPKGYLGSRDVALKLLGDLETHPFYRPPSSDARLPRAVSAEEAIGDLPPLREHLRGMQKRGARRFDTPIPDVLMPPSSDYQRRMREWVGMEGDGRLYDHVIRLISERDSRIFLAMEPGDEYPAAKEIAESLWRSAGAKPSRRKDYVPPYDVGKFPNKWRKMESDAPARTLMAHLGKDTYSHIHYDSGQARTISVREAARLQSFPDGFAFRGTMNPAFRQIGNAVPPLLAAHIAESIRQVLTEACDLSRMGRPA